MLRMPPGGVAPGPKTTVDTLPATVVAPPGGAAPGPAAVVGALLAAEEPGYPGSAGRFDGVWEMASGKQDVARWLRRLVIKGCSVTGGTGQVFKLEPGVDGGVYLEGGRLDLGHNVLRRLGRTLTVVYGRAAA